MQVALRAERNPGSEERAEGEGRDGIGMCQGVCAPPCPPVPVVYGRMLAWLQPSSTYPDGQLALGARLQPKIQLLLLLHGSLLTARGQGRAREPLQGNTDTSAHPRAAPQPPAAPSPAAQGAGIDQD